MIYYVSLDNPNPSGGVRTQYRHVEILNDHGYPASMLHQKPGFTAATWFTSRAPVRSAPEVEIGPGDVLVWPEILRTSIHHLGGIKQIIFNQNIHYTFRGSYAPGLPVISTNPRYDYAHGAVATMVLTEYERDQLRLFVPGHRVAVVEHGIDPGVFGYDGRSKKKQIAFMPRKHQDEAENVFGWLATTGALKGWDVVAIDQATEAQTAEILKDSAIFFAFGYPEGGTLPPFEAMACGAITLGYGGFASDRLMEECGGICVSSGNTMAFAQKARYWLENYPYLPGEIEKKLSEKTLNRFPMEREAQRLTEFMKEIMSA